MSNPQQYTVAVTLIFEHVIARDDREALGMAEFYCNKLTHGEHAIADGVSSQILSKTTPTHLTAK